MKHLSKLSAEQKGKSSENSRRQPLFLYASFDKNTKTYIKFNREPKLQNTSVTDLAKEVFSLKKEVCELKEKVRRLEGDVEFSFKIDSWARQEIKTIKEKLEYIPPPLEDAPFETILQEQTTAEMQGITGMQVLPIKYQKYYVQIQLEINQEIFSLTALIDTRSDLNLLHKYLIPAKYWQQWR